MKKNEYFLVKDSPYWLVVSPDNKVIALRILLPTAQDIMKDLNTDLHREDFSRIDPIDPLVKLKCLLILGFGLFLLGLGLAV